MMVSISEYVEMTALRHQGGPFVKTLNGIEFGEYLRLEAEQWKAIVVGITGDSVRIERHVEVLQHVAGQVTDQNLDVVKTLYLSTRALAVEAVNSAIGVAESYKRKNARKQRGQGSRYSKAHDWLWWAVYFCPEHLDRKNTGVFMRTFKQLLDDNDISQPSDENTLRSKYLPHIQRQVELVRARMEYAQYDPEYDDSVKPSENIWLSISVRDAGVVPKRAGDNSPDPMKRVQAFIAEGDHYLTASKKLPV